jgi:hypothetical protein
MLQESSASPLAGPPTTDLVLEPLPNGELAWLGPNPNGSDSHRVILTQRGSDLLARWRAARWLFGAEVSA